MKLGSYAETSHGYRGRVYTKDHYFTGESEEWFQGQVPPLPESCKKETWYHVLVNDGGAVYVPESRIKEVPAFEFSNPYADFYFGEGE